MPTGQTRPQRGNQPPPHRSRPPLVQARITAMAQVMARYWQNFGSCTERDLRQAGFGQDEITRYADDARAQAEKMTQPTLYT